MIIVCPSCRKKFELEDNLIPEKGRLLKCGSCNRTWFFNKNIDLQTKHSTETVNEKTKIVKENLDISNKKNKNFKQNLISDKRSQLVKYSPSSGFSFGKFLNYIIVFIITFIALIIILDTFKVPLSVFFPNLELILYNLFETLRDLTLFAKDLR